MVYVIIGDSFTFPEGDAATNRVYTYAKGFCEHGINVHVIGFRNDYITIQSGETGGIKYYHPFNQAERHHSFFIRRVHKLQKYSNTIKLLKEVSKEDKIEQITVYTTRLNTHLFAWFLSRTFKSKLIKECSEHPLRLYQKNIFSRGLGHIKFRIETAFCDGIFCISRFLQDFYAQYGFPESKMLLIPSTVDPTRFNGKSENPLPYPYIGYFGALTFRRDNVDVLIRAYARICDHHPELSLVMGGPGTNFDRQQIEDLVNELNIQSRFTMLKYMPRSEITKYIKGSEVLVMVRSKDMESQASFPSKLTEYLAASRPLITVDVGEISTYLEDGINAFLVPPGDYIKLSEKLEYVLENYDKALSIAMEGKKLTDTVFNFNYQAGRIIRFVETL